jgi:hypothetical protein
VASSAPAETGVPIEPSFQSVCSPPSPPESASSSWFNGAPHPLPIALPLPGLTHSAPSHSFLVPDPSLDAGSLAITSAGDPTSLPAPRSSPRAGTHSPASAALPLRLVPSPFPSPRLVLPPYASSAPHPLIACSPSASLPSSPSFSRASSHSPLLLSLRLLSTYLAASLPQSLQLRSCALDSLVVLLQSIAFHVKHSVCADALHAYIARCRQFLGQTPFRPAIAKYI